MQTYLDGMNDVLSNGFDHSDRTGVGRRSVFGRQYRFDLTKGFPLVTTKKVSIDNIIKETLWFISGSQRSLDLQEQGVNIWKQWTPTAEDAEAFIEKTKQNLERDGAFAGFTDTNSFSLIEKDIRSRVGTVGPLYGAVWRGKYSDGYHTSHPDQIANLITGLRVRPYHSRHCVTAWIPNLLPYPNFSPKENVLMGLGALAPCHCFFQCFVTPAEQEGGKLRLSLNINIR